MNASVAVPAIAALAAGAILAALALLFASAPQDDDDGSNSNGPPFLSLDVPADFAIVYSYGYANHITLDTSKNLYSVGMCNEPPVKNATLALSQDELHLLWTSVYENDFFAIGDMTEECPDTSFASCMSIEPESTATLQVTAAGNTHTVNYMQNYELNHHDSDGLARFNNIASTIEGVLARHPELPRSICTFL